MGVFEHFPYVNYHELNLSWILRKLKELEDVIGTQIVDLVARSGVAENAQAISDLTETVETNATTAHNEASAAAEAAATADGKAVAAQTTANTANTKADTAIANTTNTVLTGSNAINLSAQFSSVEIGQVSLYRNGKIVCAYFVFGGANLSAGANTIGTIPEGYRPPKWTSDEAAIGAGSDTGTTVRLTITNDGEVIIYAPSPIASTVRVTITYIIN